MASTLAGLGLTTVTTSLPTIQLDLKASINQLQWIMDVFLIAQCAFMVNSVRVAESVGNGLSA